MKNNKSGVRDGGWVLHSRLPVYRTRKCLVIRVISNDLGETYVSINLATYINLLNGPIAAALIEKEESRVSLWCAGKMQDTTRVCEIASSPIKEEKKIRYTGSFINARKDALYQVPQGEKSERERRGKGKKNLD